MELLQIPYATAKAVLNKFRADATPGARPRKPSEIEIGSEVLLYPGGSKLCRSSIGGRVVYHVFDYSQDGRHIKEMGL